MDLQRYLQIIKKWLWLVILAVVVAAGSSYVASKAATPLYESKTTLMVGRTIENPDPTSVDLYTGQQLAQTYAQLVSREPVLEGVISRLGLEIGWQSLSWQVAASVIPQTQLLDIRVIDSDPARAQALAGAVAQQLIMQTPASTLNADQEQSAFTQEQLSELKTKIEDGQEDVIQLKQQLDAANSSRLIQDLQTQINLTENKIDNWQATYTQLLLLQKGGQLNVLTVIEEATLPMAPYTPNVRNNVFLAAAIGFILAAGGVILIEFLDDSLRSVEDVERLIKLPVLASISTLEGSGDEERLIAMRQPLSPQVEAYRLMRANLKYQIRAEGRRTIMVTSANPKEGKSVTAANMATVFAQAGLRVILVDADLRRPTQDYLFGISNRYGLIHAIDNPNSLLSTLLQPTQVENLTVLTSGGLGTSSLETLDSNRMNDLIEQLKELADLIIFDTPPALLVADPLVLGQILDGAIVVADFPTTTSRNLRKTVEALKRVRIPVLGIVLNRVKGETPAYYRRYFSKENSRGGFRAGWFTREQGSKKASLHQSDSERFDR